jgi:hypothetical protein
MTQPIRDPKAGKRRAKQGEPFDPEDLSRRLTAHLSEQKVKAEVRRAARDAKVKAAADAHLYHHVPTVAAADFERTMTPNVLRSVPKLARPVSRAHMEVRKVEGAGAAQPTSLKKPQAKDQGILERQPLSNRNQIPRTHGSEEVGEVDKERNVHKLPQRTFPEFNQLEPMSCRSGPRPMSTGDVLWREELLAASRKPKPKSRLIHERSGRHDWTQRDDEVDRKNEQKLSSQSRKKDSSWIMLGMKSAKHESGIDNADISTSDTSSSKSRGGFLARFKRHPS